MEFWHCGEPHRIPIFRENPWIFDFPWIFLFFSSISHIFTTVPASEIRHSTPRRQKVPGQGIQGRRRQRRQRRRQVRQVSSHPGVAQKSVIRVNPRECWCSSWWIYPWLIVVIVLYYNHIIPYLDFWVNYNDRTLFSLTGNHGLFEGNHPQMAELFRLVTYYNLPRSIYPWLVI